MPIISLNQHPFFYAHHHNQPATHHIILIHGAGGSHLVWPAALRRLPDAHIYAVDLPGHGRSVGEGYPEITAYANIIKQFIHTLALNNVILVGHSMGSAIAQTIGLHQLSEVSGLVLIGAGAKLRVSPTILNEIMPNFEQTVTAVNQFNWSAAAPPQIVSKGRDILAQTAPTVLYNDFSACDCFDIREQLTQIKIPTLVIAGSEDKMTPPKYGRFLADNIPQAEFKLIDGAGHMMMIEKPGETTAFVQQFLEKL
jgi:pimeloyl-ACP methyl ester carboxylesterase